MYYGLESFLSLYRIYRFLSWCCFLLLYKYVILIKIVLMNSFFVYKTDITFPTVLLLLGQINRCIIQEEQEKVEEIFNKSDMNEDGHLTQHQFFNFIADSQTYFEPIFKIKTNILNSFFPHKSYIDILERKVMIEDIKSYQVNNNGKLPQKNCSSSFKSCLFGLPNPYAYDYESTSDILSFDTLVNIQIKTYKPDFEPAKKRETFQIKHLSQFTKYKTVNKIDNYFIKFRNASPYKLKSLEERRKNTVASSNNTMLELVVTSSRKPSILRSTTLRSRNNTLDYTLSGSSSHVLVNSYNFKRKSNTDMTNSNTNAATQEQLIVLPIVMQLGSSSRMVAESVTEEPE